MSEKGRTPLDVLSAMHTFGRLVAEDKKGGDLSIEQDMTRALLRVSDLIEAGNALELHYVEPDGLPGHWTFNHNGARRFMRALAAVQVQQ